MLNPIKEIANWQIKAGNASRPYDDFLESSFQVEEALEGFILPREYLFDESGNVLVDATVEEKREKHIARDIISWANNTGGTESVISDVARLDKACDAIVYAIGSMQKLGLDHHGITKALNIVNKANMQKLNAPRDDAGKLLKPDNFVGPEAELQELLNKYK